MRYVLEASMIGECNNRPSIRLRSEGSIIQWVDPTDELETQKRGNYCSNSRSVIGENIDAKIISTDLTTFLYPYALHKCTSCPKFNVEGFMSHGVWLFNWYVLAMRFKSRQHMDLNSNLVGRVYYVLPHFLDFSLLYDITASTNSTLCVYRNE